MIKPSRFQSYQNVRYVISVLLILETIYAFCNKNVWIEGHFDNPAGFAMFVVACFPFMYYIDCVQHNQYIRHSIEIIFMAIIALTGSRTGIIALIMVIGIYYLRKRKSGHDGLIKIASAAFVCFFLIGLYYFKKDSADGRMLIWKCTCDMIAQKPMFGYGADGFRKHYMNFQEQYFATHPDSSYAELADNVVHPFNEYLHLIVNYGFIGIIILFSAIAFVLYKFPKENIHAHYDSVLSILAIGVFSLFSYPFSYTVCWVITIYNFIVITGLSNKFQTALRPSYKLTLSLLILSIGAIYWQLSAGKRKATETWQILSRQSFDNEIDKYKYFEAGETLNNAEFWYELAARFYFYKMYNDCIDAANRSEMLYNNSDIQILKGVCFTELGRYDLAKQHYQSAHDMCPKLIKPLYLLVKLHEQTGDTVTAKSMALQVLNKKVKIESFETEIMRDDLKKYIMD